VLFTIQFRCYDSWLRTCSTYSAKCHGNWIAQCFIISKTNFGYSGLVLDRIVKYSIASIQGNICQN
jgi:hypothetical protein